jgi:hypothetical protein
LTSFYVPIVLTPQKHENLGQVEVRLDELDFKKDARAVVPIKVAANIQSVLQDKKGKRSGKLGSIYYSTKPAMAVYYHCYFILLILMNTCMSFLFSSLGIFLHPKNQGLIFMAEPLEKHLGPLICESTFLVRHLGPNGEPRAGYEVG